MSIFCFCFPPLQKSQSDTSQGGENQPLLPISAAQHPHPEPHWHHGLRLLSAEWRGPTSHQNLARLFIWKSHLLHGEAHLCTAQHIQQHQTPMRQEFGDEQSIFSFIPLQNDIDWLMYFVTPLCSRCLLSNWCILKTRRAGKKKNLRIHWTLC